MDRRWIGLYGLPEFLGICVDGSGCAEHQLVDQAVKELTAEKACLLYFARLSAYPPGLKNCLQLVIAIEFSS